MSNPQRIEAVGSIGSIPRRLQRPALKSRAEFWNLADSERTAAEYRVDRHLVSLRTAPLHVLKRVFVQYRFFTHSYISDLGILVARLPFGPLRSSLGEFLSEELGDGDPADAHPQLYDDFLHSVGVQSEELDHPLASNTSLLNDISYRMHTGSVAAAIGLRGMGGECLCQIYLSVMHEHFSCNPAFTSIRTPLAMKFWDIHTGDVDIEHRLRTRAAIDEYLVTRPDELDDLWFGYEYAKGAWDSFWTNIFNDAQQGYQS